MAGPSDLRSEPVVTQAWPTGAAPQQPASYAPTHIFGAPLHHTPVADPVGAHLLPTAGVKRSACDADAPASGKAKVPRAVVDVLPGAATPDVSSHGRVNLLLSGVSRSSASPKGLSGGGGGDAQPKKKRASGVRKKADGASIGKGAKGIQSGAGQTPGSEGAGGASSTKGKVERKASSAKTSTGGKASSSKTARGGYTPALRKVRAPTLPLPAPCIQLVCIGIVIEAMCAGPSSLPTSGSASCACFRPVQVEDRATHHVCSRRPATPSRSLLLRSEWRPQQPQDRRSYLAYMPPQQPP